MAKLHQYIVQHDRTQQRFVVRGKNRRTVAKRYPVKDYTVLERVDSGGKRG